MSLSNKLNAINNNGGVNANTSGNVESQNQSSHSTPVPQAPPVGGGKAAGKFDNAKSEEFRAMGKQIRANMTADQLAIEGTKRDSLAFVSALGDPTKKQNRSVNNLSLPSYRVVGYRFKVLEDMEIPDIPFKEDGVTDVLDVVDICTMRMVRAGTVVDLNLVETALLLSRPEFAGGCTGEGESVIIDAKFKKDRPVPLPALKKTVPGSVKENMVLIAKMVMGADNKEIPQIEPGFEKFAVLLKKKSAGSKTSTAVNTAGESTKDLAAAFNKFYGDKLKFVKA